MKTAFFFTVSCCLKHCRNGNRQLQNRLRQYSWNRPSDSFVPPHQTLSYPFHGSDHDAGAPLHPLPLSALPQKYPHGICSGKNQSSERSCLCPAPHTSQEVWFRRVPSPRQHTCHRYNRRTSASVRAHPLSVRYPP